MALHFLCSAQEILVDMAHCCNSRHSISSIIGVDRISHATNTPPSNKIFLDAWLFYTAKPEKKSPEAILPCSIQS